MSEQPRRSMQIRPVHLIVLSVLCAACGSGTRKEPALAEAFTGPIELRLREEIIPGTKIVATVKHGDRLEVLQTRRRFVRVRTPDGVVGWTDVRQLMTPQQMAKLKGLFDAAAKLPSQGEATVYDILNVHTLPLRQSPSFYQLKEGELVDVVAHQISPRTGGPEVPVFRIPKPPPPPRKKREKQEPEVPPPPKPPSPALPENWLKLSKTDLPPEPPPKPERKEPPSPPVRMEDWSLIRTKDGKAGWVLTRNLIMAIPDEVAQYAEGHRITSYFSLGTVNDDGLIKHNWLWTTHSDSGVPEEYNGFRVFIWALKRHRYETAYIERKVKGYYPTFVESGVAPKFSLLLENEDGSIWRKTYAFEGYLVRKIAEEPAAKPEPVEDFKEETDTPESVAPAEEKKSIAERIKEFFGKS